MFWMLKINGSFTLFVAVFLGYTSTGRVGLCPLWFLCPGTPEGSTGSGSGFKASQKMGQRLKVSSNRLGEAGNQIFDPWFTRHRFIPYTTMVLLRTNNIRGLSQKVVDFCYNARLCVRNSMKYV